MSGYTNGNSDNITRAVEGLDIFTKNWCMDCEETDRQNDLIFRCKQCEFQREDEKCLIKIFAKNHEHDFDMSKFGSMSH